MLTRRQLLQTTAASGLISTIPFGASLAADAPRAHEGVSR